jgi:hypothetical protein
LKIVEEESKPTPKSTTDPLPPGTGEPPNTKKTNISPEQVVPVSEGLMLEPVSAETGNGLSNASQQVASASLAQPAAQIIQNFYGTGANQSGGNAPMTVPIAAGSDGMGLSSFITALAPIVIS